MKWKKKKKMTVDGKEKDTKILKSQLLKVAKLLEEKVPLLSIIVRQGLAKPVRASTAATQNRAEVRASLVAGATGELPVRQSRGKHASQWYNERRETKQTTGEVRSTTTHAVLDVPKKRPRNDRTRVREIAQRRQTRRRPARCGSCLPGADLENGTGAPREGGNRGHLSARERDARGSQASEWRTEQRR